MDVGYADNYIDLGRQQGARQVLAASFAPVECAEAARDAYMLHLWNNTVVSMGVWKELALPEGVFLWGYLHDRGLLSLFQDSYPAEVMRRMLKTWHFRKNGGDIRIVKLTKQVFPSIVRRWRRGFELPCKRERELRDFWRYN
jgi:hypothetical protein